MLDHREPVKEVQFCTGRPNELLGVSLGLHSWGWSVVDPPKSYDGPLEPVHLVQEALHALLPLHLD